MKRTTKIGLLFTVCLAQAAFFLSRGAAQPAAHRGAAARPGSESAPAAEHPTCEDPAALTAQDREVLAWANDFAKEVTQVLEKWVQSNSVAEDKLFSRFYFPVPKTDPPKFNTEYDALADRELPAIQERYLAKSSAMVYAILTDENGYVPTHNQRYSQPPTGNRAVDLVNSRSKRIFVDRTGFAAARSEAPHLVQRYQRDTGERMADLSIPVRVRGKHWGCIRMGYNVVEK
jgi:methyl-accepting chemotaxis protein